MSLFLTNLLLAIAWAAVSGSFTLANLVFGFVLSAIALYLIREQVGYVGYITRSWRVISLAALFVYELILSAWRVTTLVLSPRMDVKPGIFAYPMKVDRDGEITLLANLITLTPGTLSIDVSDDRRTLYVHALDCSDVDRTSGDIADGFERKILEAFR